MVGELACFVLVLTGCGASKPPASAPNPPEAHADADATGMQIDPDASADSAMSSDPHYADPPMFGFLTWVGTAPTEFSRLRRGWPKQAELDVITGSSQETYAIERTDAIFGAIRAVIGRGNGVARFMEIGGPILREYLRAKWDVYVRYARDVKNARRSAGASAIDTIFELHRTYSNEIADLRGTFRAQLRKSTAFRDVTTENIRDVVFKVLPYDE